MLSNQHSNPTPAPIPIPTPTSMPVLTPIQANTNSCKNMSSNQCLKGRDAGLPFVHEWKLNRQKWENGGGGGNKVNRQKYHIKFEIIGRESLPYLDRRVRGGDCGGADNKGFRKINQKQSSSFHLLNKPNTSKLSPTIKSHLRSQSAESPYKHPPSVANMVSQQQSQSQVARLKKAFTLQKLQNRRNQERQRLRHQYENLRINTIIQCAMQELTEKQNMMLNGII